MSSTITKEEIEERMKKPLVQVKNARRAPALGDTTCCSYHRRLTPASPYASVVLSYPQYSDMPTEMGHEAVEIVTMGLDKHGKNYEAASSFVKQTFDKKFGSSWQCAIGEGFGFDISCQRKFLLHVYYGKAAALCYKSG